jgi:hypothetical protein
MATWLASAAATVGTRTATEPDRARQGERDEQPDQHRNEQTRAGAEDPNRYPHTPARAGRGTTGSFEP